MVPIQYGVFSRLLFRNAASRQTPSPAVKSTSEGKRRHRLTVVRFISTLLLLLRSSSSRHFVAASSSSSPSPSPLASFLLSYPVVRQCAHSSQQNSAVQQENKSPNWEVLAVRETTAKRIEDALPVGWPLDTTTITLPAHFLSPAFSVLYSGKFIGLSPIVR